MLLERRLFPLIAALAGSVALADSTPNVGAASSFVLLGGTSVTNVGHTIISGNAGVSPGTRIDLGDATFKIGGIQQNTALARDAQRDAAALADSLPSQPCTDLTVFPPKLDPNHVYCFAQDAHVSGTLVFDGGADDVWVIRVAGTLRTDPDSFMVLNGGADSSHIFWVAGAASIGDGSAIAGNVISRTDVVFGRAATIAGRAWGRQGAVTLDTDAVNLCGKLVVLSRPIASAGTVGADFTSTIAASGGDAPYTFALLDGSLPQGLPLGLPPGLHLSATGTISGQPSEAGSFSFAVTATDSNATLGAVGVRVYTISVCPNIVLPPNLPPAVACQPYHEPFAATGAQSFLYSVSGLPPGLSPPTHDNPFISGTPKTHGDFTIVVTATDPSSSCSASATYTLQVLCDLIVTAALPPAVACTQYSGKITANCPGTTFHLASGALPPEMKLLPDGTIFGPATTPGPYVFTVVADSTTGCSVVTQELSIAVAPAAPLPPLNLLGTDCTFLSYSVPGTTTSRLPRGLGLTGGVLSGVPREIGTFPLTVTLASANACPPTQQVSITIGCPTSVLSPDLPHTLPFYKPVDIPLLRDKLSDCFTCAVTQGMLPSGLRLDTTNCHVVDKPDALGSWTAVITATDSVASCEISESYTLEIVDPPLCGGPISISPSSTLLPNGTVGVPYVGQTFTAANGTAPYKYDVPVTPTLAPGLTLSTAGTLSGTPTKAGRFNFAVRATDSTGATGCPEVYTVVIAP